jgi:hypothetical protein
MATPLLPCPTPHKRTYVSRGHALAGVVESVNGPTPVLWPYLCRCGSWHLTSTANRPDWRS